MSKKKNEEMSSFLHLTDSDRTSC